MAHKTEVLSGTGPSPLAATRSYAFFTQVAEDGTATLWAPYTMRGPFDDRGVAEHPEQIAFLARWLTGHPCRSTSDIEWTFSDAAALEATAAALRATLQPPVSVPPSASASRQVSAAEARSCESQVPARVHDLVAAVAGRAHAFVSIENHIDTDDYAPKRREVWRSDDVTITLEAEGIASGHGVHGERASFTVAGLPQGTSVTAYADIDLRSGGSLHTTVRGVLDAQALADRFIASFS